MKTTILIPSDFSEPAQYASDYAIHLFGKQNTVYVLFHAVVQPRASNGMLINISQLMVKNAEESLREEETRIKAKFGDDIEVVLDTSLTDLNTALPSLEKKHDLNAVVMGTKGESNVVSKVMGSNTEKLIRTAPLPVLAVPVMEEEGLPESIIISMADDNEADKNRISNLLNRMNLEQAKIEVLSILQGEEKAAKAVEFGNKNVHVHAVRAEEVSSGILDFITSRGVDMLVLVHKHNTRFNYLFGQSITKKIAGQIEIPMLVFPED
jgi:nucleotide-binding universal stress UspA family protein